MLILAANPPISASIELMVKVLATKMMRKTVLVLAVKISNSWIVKPRRQAKSLVEIVTPAVWSPLTLHKASD
jgi:hypothetical protein